MVRFCSNCGIEIKENTNFCENCGLKFSKDNGIFKQSNPSKPGTPWALVLIAFIAGVVIYNVYNNSPIDTPKPLSTFENPSIDSPSITPAEITSPTQKPVPIEIDWTPPTVPNDLDRALSDYKWRMDLVTEQTTRLDMYYASKSGSKMSRDEFKGWLDALQAQTTEFIKRNKDAIYSGDNYANLINANINKLNYKSAVLEIERVNQNKVIMANDIKTTIDSFNQNAAIYNDWGK